MPEGFEYTIPCGLSLIVCIIGGAAILVSIIIRERDNPKYQNSRHQRSLAKLFILFGSLALFAGIIAPMEIITLGSMANGSSNFSLNIILLSGSFLLITFIAYACAFTFAHKKKEKEPGIFESEEEFNNEFEEEK